MNNNNTNFQVGGGYSVDLAAYHDAVITHRIDELRDNGKVFMGPKSSQEEIQAYYDKIKEAIETGKGVVINISNHSSSTWSREQKEACGDAIIIDEKFPNINPAAEADDLDAMCFCYADWLTSTVNNISRDRVTFLVAGAQGALFRIVGFLKMAGYAVMEATSERNTTINADGSKTVRFDFVRFRSF